MQRFKFEQSASNITKTALLAHLRGLFFRTLRLCDRSNECLLFYMYTIYNFVAGDVITTSAQHELYFVNQALVLRAHRNHIAFKKKMYSVNCS